MDILMQNFNNYIEEKASNYAVMLKGPWGSGKSYFIENKWLRSLDSEKYDIKNISLNGMTSINDLLSNIGKTKIEKGINKKVDYRVKYFVESVTKFFGNKYNVNFSISEYNRLLGENWLEKEDEKVKILIIDDLERTKIVIEELFGFILQYISKQNLKVIIVCNEEELKSISEDRYDKVKEKLIGETFSIAVDKREVLNSFIDNIEIKEIYKTAIKNVFVDILKNSKYSNLRVIYRSFLKFAYILKFVDNVIGKNNYHEDVIFRYVKELFSIFFYLYYQKEIGLIDESKLFFIDKYYHLGDFIPNDIKKEDEKEIDIRILSGRFIQKFIPFRNNNFGFYKDFIFQGNSDIYKYEIEIKEDLDYVNLRIEEEKENNKDCLYRLMTEFFDCSFENFKKYQRDFYNELKTKTKCSINYLFMGYVYLVYFYEKDILHIEELKSIENIDSLFDEVIKNVKLEIIEKYMYFRNEWSVFALGYRGQSFDFDSLKHKDKLNDLILKLRDAYFCKMDKNKVDNFILILNNYDGKDNYYLNNLDGLNKYSSIETQQNNLFWDIDILNQVGFEKLKDLILKRPLKAQQKFWCVIESYYSKNGDKDILKKELDVLKSFEVEYKNKLKESKDIRSNASLYFEWIVREIGTLVNKIENLK